MLDRSVTCYVHQRNTGSIMNVGLNYVFVSVCKVNLSAQLLYVIVKSKLFTKCWWSAASKGLEVVRAKQKVGNPSPALCHAADDTVKRTKLFNTFLTFKV